MRHKNAGRKFDRNTSSRRAMFRNLAANLILHEHIETTDRYLRAITVDACVLGEVFDSLLVDPNE